MRETWVWSLGWKDPRRRKCQPAPVFLPIPRGAWQATVHRVVKSQTRLSDFIFTFRSSIYVKRMNLELVKKNSNVLFIVPNATIRWTLGNCWDIYDWVFSGCWMFHIYINNCSISPVVRKIYLTLKGKHVSSDLKCCQSDKSHLIT